MLVDIDRDRDSLRSQRARFVAFAFAGNDVLIEVDDDGIITYCGGLLRPVLGREAEDLRGGFVHDLVAASDLLRFDELMLRLRHTGRLDRIPVLFQKADGSTRRVHVSALTLADAPGWSYLALTPVRERAVPATPAATMPVGTEAFAARLRDRIGGHTVAGDTRLTLLDLNPETVGRSLPADRADSFISSALDTLSAWSVGGDAAGRLENGAVGVLHEAALSGSEISRRLNDMLALFEPGAEPLELRSATVAMDVGELSDEDLTKAVLYTVNSFARNDTTFALTSLSAGYREAMDEALGKVSTFRRTIASEALTLVYQPIVELGTWKVHHYEALARVDAGGKRMPPAPLIAFAEEFGVMEEMDMAVVRRALAALAANRGLRSGARIAVNLSGRSIGSDRFCGDLLALLEAHRHLLPRLKFEVTESHAVADLARANRVLQRLRGMGCAVCIDDFGAGAAAFPYLKALEVDYVKIDGSYIRDAFTSRHGRPFLRAIAGLARDLGIQCIGEMVEDADTHWLLRELGIGYGQGWFFGRPAADVSAFTLAAPPLRPGAALL